MTRDAGYARDALQLEALLFSRAYLYELFHKLLGGTPDEEVLGALLGQTTADVVEEFSGGDGELAPFGHFLAELRAGDRANLLERSRDEYTRVLIGPLALPASPYESPYTGAHDTALFQENTLAVRGLYREAGVQARRLGAVPDDHVALMCAFASGQSQRALAALRAGDCAGLAALLRSQHAFVRGHLTNWLGTYARSVRNSKAGAAAVLYPQLIEALSLFATADAAFLAESAFWAEGVEAAALPSQDAASPELAGVQGDLERLSALSPFGIQDNELVPIKETSGQPRGLI